MFVFDSLRTLINTARQLTNSVCYVTDNGFVAGGGEMTSQDSCSAAAETNSLTVQFGQCVTAGLCRLYRNTDNSLHDILLLWTIILLYTS